MAVITPQSDVYLLKVPLEINDINQLTFSNATAQFNYFNSLPKITADNFTYQRKDGTIRFPGHFDDLLNYNYVMYRNDAYSNKWFYAFITGMEYLNDNVTAIAIKTDVWQTYQFDLTYKRCLIDREHTNDDTIGANTLPEGLELGEIITNGDIKNFGIKEDPAPYYVLVIDVTQIENPGTNQTLTYSWTNSQTTPLPRNNSIPSGLYHIVMGMNSYAVPNFRRLIDVYNKAGLSDAIQNIYILPQDVVGTIQTGLTLSTTGSAPSDSISGLGMPVSSIYVSQLGSYDYTVPTTIDGYTPKNNKLLTFPYSYMNVSNNAGTTIPYHYEDFAPTQPYPYIRFDVEGVLCPSGSIKAIPRNYKGISYQSEENAYDYAINGAKFPMCNWTTDSYTNWLTQNAVNMDIQWKETMLGAGASIGAGLLSGGGLGVFTGAVKAGGDLINLALSQYTAKSQANLVPDQAHGNMNSGDIVFSKLRSRFTFIPMSIKQEYAKCIDDFFSAFGYKTNRVKLPNITGRRNWNYVKTIGCYIEADIPQGDLQEIKEMFDKGITLWHNPATFMDYSQNNDII